MEGFFQIHRQIFDSWIFADDKALKIFIWLIGKARHKDGVVPLRIGKGVQTIKLKKGQLIFGRHKAEEELFYNGSLIYRKLQKLESDNTISIESNNQYSIITVCKYEEYQFSEKKTNKQCTSNAQATDSEQTSNEQAANTNNTVNTVKKEKNNINPDDEIIEKLNSFNPKILSTCKWFIDKLDEKASKRITLKNKLAWCNTLEKCNRIDGFSFERIFEIVKFTKEDSFWNPNFLTLNKLREKKQGEDLTFIFRWDAKLKAPKSHVKETYEQTTSRVCVNKKYTF